MCTLASSLNSYNWLAFIIGTNNVWRSQQNSILLIAGHAIPME